MHSEDHVTVIAQLRQARRLMARGNLDVQETLEVLKLYEQGVCALMTTDQVVKYIEARMALADEFLG